MPEHHHHKGQALIETALVLFVLAAFVIGTFDFGQFLYFHQALAERARAAARYGAVNPADRTGIQNVAIFNDPAGAASGTTPVLPNLRAGMISVCLPGDLPCADPATGPEARVTVTISGYQMTTFNLFVPHSFSNNPISASQPSEAP